MEHIERLFDTYGYYVLFFGLLLEYIALPFPGATSMGYAGYLAYEGMLHPLPLIISALLGTTLGVTITYIIGYKIGLPLIRRYGKWIFFSSDKMLKMELWFGKHGNKLLFIAYFIPGVRHFTGYTAGIVRLPFRIFAIYSYSGAMFWVLVYIGLGWGLGPQWEQVVVMIDQYAVKLIFAAGFVLLLYTVFRFRITLKNLFRRKKS